MDELELAVYDERRRRQAERRITTPASHALDAPAPSFHKRDRASRPHALASR